MEKKKRKKEKKVRQIKAIGVGLEGFVDWVNPISSESAEERESNMSSLIVGFSTRMSKRATSSQGETTLGSEASGEKHPKWSGPDEEAQNGQVVITMDSPEQASDALSALEGVAQDASEEACASLEDGASAGGPPNANQAVSEALAA